MKIVVITATLLLAFCGCSSGPQIPVSTPVINVACTWNVMDGGTCTECICTIDRSSALSKPITTGNEIPTSTQIDAQVDVHADGEH